MQLSEQEIVRREKLLKLNPNKAIGPDHIHNIILKTLAKELSLLVNIILINLHLRGVSKIIG